MNVCTLDCLTDLVSKSNEKNSIVKPMKLTVELDPEPEVPESSSLTEILYHMTNRDSAEKIKSSNKMIPGIKGKFGPAIYFTDNPLTCASKSIFGSTSLITAKVQLRNMLESNVPLPYINKQILEKYRKNCLYVVLGLDCIKRTKAKYSENLLQDHFFYFLLNV